jgi:hypothetical protein
MLTKKKEEFTAIVASYILHYEFISTIDYRCEGRRIVGESRGNIGAIR